MSTRRRRYYLGGLLLLILWCGACTNGARPAGFISSSYVIDSFGPPDVDVEPIRSTGGSAYRQPRIARRYQFDHTEVDLATPLPSAATDGRAAE